MNFQIKPGSEPPNGVARIPGDKSVTHRAFLLGALAEGETVISGANRGDDCMRTAAALRQLGVSIREEESRFIVEGSGGQFNRSDSPLDMGNSGTGTRLLSGLLAGQPFSTTLDGDESLRERPMGRIVRPLREMGAKVTGRRDGSLLPLTIEGGDLQGIRYKTPVASAQVKSAVLLAGLLARGTTELIEPALSRDHTEKMVAYLGGAIKRDGLAVRVEGGGTLRGAPIEVGGDPSSAAFLIVAALIIPGAEITVEGVLDNPTRTAFLDALARMGGDITRESMPVQGPEGTLRVTVRHSTLKAIDIGGDEIPALIDEVPILAVAGAHANGAFRVMDAGELRVKESDRIKTTVDFLRRFGADAHEEGDGFVIGGSYKKKQLKGATVSSGGDHRIAMAAAVIALAAKGKSTIRDVDCVGTSFPEFLPLLAGLGLGEAIREVPGK